MNPSETATLPPSDPGPASVPGTITVAGYEILGELGRGGMGVVYKARHIKLGRLVALKMILVAEHAGAAERARFQTEAEAVARLQDPNIVQIYEIGEQDGRPFFSLEFCPGGSLEKKLGGIPLPPKEAAALAQTLAQAIHTAHEAGIVHRDLKPANVLLTEDGTPKITDFGLAKKLDPASPGRESGGGLTATGAVMGTPSYMAPEQAGGKSKDIGPCTDVYALGAILYEMLTGRPPFRAAALLDTILQVVSDEPVPPSQLQPKTPRDLETICLKCLQKEPGKRHISAAALAEDLRRFQNGEPIQARPVGRVERSWRWCRRNPVGAALVAVLVVGTAAATGLAVWAMGERNRADQYATAARDSETKARENEQQALREKAQKDEQLTRAEWLLYAGQMNMAQAAWDGNRADLAWDFLKRTKPDYRGWEYRYLAAEFQGNQRVFQIDKGIPALSPDGKWLALTATSGVQLWDVDTGQRVHVLPMGKGVVFNVCFSPDGKRLADSGTDSTVRLWEVGTGQKLHDFKVPTGNVSGMCFSPDGKRLAGIAQDKTVRIWDTTTWLEVASLKVPAELGSAVTFSPDGKRLAGATLDRTVRIWNTDSQQELHSLKGHGDAVVAVAFSPDGKRFASASFDRTVRIWDTDKGTELLVLKGHGDSVFAVAFSPDGTRLASASKDRTVVWDTNAGKELFALKGNAGIVFALAFRGDGKRLASASYESARVWDMEKVAVPLLRHADHVTSIAFGRDSRQLIGAPWDGTIRIWDTNERKMIRTITVEPRPDAPVTMKIDPGTGQMVRVKRGDVCCLCLSPDGKTLAGGTADQTVHAWDTQTWQEICVLKVPLPVKAPAVGVPTGFRLPADEVFSVCFRPDGKRLAGAAADQTVYVWDTETWEEVCVLRGHTGFVSSVCYSPDGKLIATGCQDNKVRLWDAETGQVIHTFTRHTGAVSYVVFSPDGKHLASASADKTARLWNVETGEDKEVCICNGHTHPLTAVIFSSDGKRLVSASHDQTVRIWDAERGQEVLILKGHTAFVTALAFSPDGKRLASASQDGTVRLWDAE